MKNKNLSFDEIFLNGDKLFHPGLSVDCVIFGFHQNQLKVLLIKTKNSGKWMLPGGYILKDSGLNEAAQQVLLARTGLKDIFLHQFYAFGDPHRIDYQFNEEFLKYKNIPAEKAQWFLQRFITIGYYALVDYSKTTLKTDAFSEACDWWDLHEIPQLLLDHNQILEKALETLRLQLKNQPIGYNLLSEKFTMPELQKLYETILGKQLDRRNFQKRMLAYGILEKLEERKQGVAHKAPYLYRFHPENYEKALKEGLEKGW